jgi:hypothetical protein
MIEVRHVLTDFLLAPINKNSGSTIFFLTRSIQRSIIRCQQLAAMGQHRQTFDLTIGNKARRLNG